MAETDIAPIIDQRSKEIDAQADSAGQREQALATKELASADVREKELAPLEDAVTKQTKELTDTRPPGSEVAQLPKYKPQPLIDEHEYTGLSYALLGMALLGGVASRGNWMGVSASLNGAMEGYMKGRQESAQKDWDNYQKQYTAAKEHDDAAQKEFENILENKKLSVNGMLQELKLAGAKYDRQDIRMAAEQKSIDAVWRQVESSRNSLSQLEERNDRAKMQLDATFQREKYRQGGAMDSLTPAGNWFIDQTLLGGNTKFLQMVQSRYGSEVASAAINNVAAELQAAGLDPRSLTENQLNLQVQKSVQTQASNRLSGVTRLTNSIMPLEDMVRSLVKDVNGTGAPTVNATMNWIADHLGSEKLSELQTMLGSVGRQYVEAITMPGSNAQLHATSQEWADGTFSRNINLPQLEGTLKAMNAEIDKTHKALLGQVTASRGNVTGAGPTIAAPGSTPAPAVPAAPVAAPAAGTGKVVDWNDL